VQCNAIKVVGSVKELQDLAIESVPDNLDLHRHVVDDLHLECFECGSIMNRIPEVFDCWFESGSMPYAAKHYPFENVDWFKHNFPSDFVSEYIGQVRAWFYYMHVISILMFGEIPFKNIVVNGNILAEDGTKMSKSKKNFPDPSLIVGLYGADALRIYLLASQLMRAKDLNFKEDNVKQIYRRFNLLLSNVLKFYSLFEINNLSINNFNSENILDKWIINLVNNLTRDVTQRLDDYDTAEASKLIINFVEDLSTWYVKNSRYRFKSDILKEQLEAMNTLTYVLHNLSKILAPFTPFMAEMIYQKLRERKLVKCESVHLDFWPVFDQSLSILNLGDKMNLIKEIVQKSLELREKANIPLRQVLKKITLKGVSLEGESLELVAKALNVKEVVIKNESFLEFTIDLDTEITKELKLEGIARTLIRNINNYRKKMKLSTNNRINLYLNTENDEILEAISKYQKEIKKMVQADAIFKKIDNKNNIRRFKINQIEISTYLEKT
jgi:isoleucyl-tRNA synthetase